MNVENLPSLHKDIQIYSRAEFSKFFRQKHWRLLQAAFNSSEKRPRYGEAAIIEEILAPYQELASLALPTTNTQIPRHIWILWQQGWDKAPPLVKACAKSWQEMNPNWQVHLVEEKTIKDFAPAYEKILAPKASRTARSNIARLSLLLENGGVWADSTLFCQQPLDQWLPKVTQSGFFMFSEPRPYRYSDIWFLASAASTPLISAWLNMVGQYWSHFNRPHHYYWMEYLFEFLANNNDEVTKTWNSTFRLSALGPLITQGLPFEKNVPQNTIKAIKERIIPAHKLSHKWRYSKSLDATPVGLLTGLKKL